MSYLRVLALCLLAFLASGTTYAEQPGSSAEDAASEALERGEEGVTAPKLMRIEHAVRHLSSRWVRGTQTAQRGAWPLGVPDVTLQQGAWPATSEPPVYMPAALLWDLRRVVRRLRSRNQVAKAGDDDVAAY